MWTIEDIEVLNPADANKQDSSFLQHVLHIGAASKKLLCETADLLEQRDSPFVAAFAQLPFSISCSDSFFTVPGGHEGVSVDLSFSPVSVAIDPKGQLIYVSPHDVKTIEPEVAWLTQVTAIVRLSSKRIGLHEAYLDCILPSGFRNKTIGRIENWMDIPEAQMEFPRRRHAPLTAVTFEGEVARHILFEVNYAVQTFLRAYSLANLEEIPTVNRLHGYFAMIAPGRLVGAQPTQPLIPIASGLCATGKYASTTIVGADRIYNLLDKQIPIEDRILAQLMAMHRLLQQGEPELALIGCITAVEWFLNERFPELKSRSKSGYERSASINDCLEKKVLNFLTDQDKEHLKDLSSARNSITHGSPPRRLNTVPNMKRREFVVDEEFVRDGLFLALDIYRAVNLNAVKSTNTAQ